MKKLLSIKDKAKRYDEAINKAKSKIKNDKDHVLYEDDVIEMFPELKESESEDEKVRKALYEYFKNRKDDGDIDETWYGISYDKILAWLEKQGEQNPADKVEHKFEIGDWVKHSFYPNNTYRIKDIDLAGDYELESVDGIRDNHIAAATEEKIKLWTIQDAKAGDVLCTYECGKPKIVFILKGTPKKHYALSYHCYYNIMYPHFGSDSEKGCLAPNDEDVKPATKEQRDTLEKAITNAGYRWDKEKLKLEKV